jgi:hypothetical protein
MAIELNGKPGKDLVSAGPVSAPAPSHIAGPGFLLAPSAKPSAQAGIEAGQ